MLISPGSTGRSELARTCRATHAERGRREAGRRRSQPDGSAASSRGPRILQRRPAGRPRYRRRAEYRCGGARWPMVTSRPSTATIGGRRTPESRPTRCIRTHAAGDDRWGRPPAPAWPRSALAATARHARSDAVATWCRQPAQRWRSWPARHNAPRASPVGTPPEPMEGPAACAPSSQRTGSWS